MIVCLDANCVIYLVENHPVWGPRVVARVATLRGAGHTLAVTDLALTECLTGPIHSGDSATLADFQAFFGDPEVQRLAITSEVCERAAWLRAASNFRLAVPDCLHLAAAITHGCGTFLTNDSKLASCSDIAVEIL